MNTIRFVLLDLPLFFVYSLWKLFLMLGAIVFSPAGVIVIIAIWLLS